MPLWGSRGINVLRAVTCGSPSFTVHGEKSALTAASGATAGARACAAARASTADRATTAVTSPTMVRLGATPVSTAPRATLPGACRAGFPGATGFARPVLTADVNLLLQHLPHRFDGFGLGFYLELNPWWCGETPG